jgi:hypothetical protein
MGLIGLNGTSTEDVLRRHRYFTQWITEHDKTKSGAAQLTVVGWCIRDRDTRDWATVFEHTDREVCEKMLKILNEG